MNNIKKRIPLEEDLWEELPEDNEDPKLIVNICKTCGELYFPKKKKGLCLNCQNTSLEDIKLIGIGKIVSFTIVERAPAGDFYKGPIPYAYGFVSLNEGVKIRSLFTGNFNALKIGATVKMVIEKLFEDDSGNEIVTYKFKPLGN